jgi:hypothetical protein
MMQSLAGEVKTALSPRHHGYAMYFKLSSCRNQLAIRHAVECGWPQKETSPDRRRSRPGLAVDAPQSRGP